MKRNTCFELPLSRGVQKCIDYPPSLADLKKSFQHPLNYYTFPYNYDPESMWTLYNSKCRGK